MNTKGYLSFVTVGILIYVKITLVNKALVGPGRNNKSRNYFTLQTNIAPVLIKAQIAAFCKFIVPASFIGNGLAYSVRNFSQRMIYCRLPRQKKSRRRKYQDKENTDVFFHSRIHVIPNLFRNLINRDAETSSA